MRPVNEFESFLSFDKSQYSNPEYLAQCRWLACLGLNYALNESTSYVDEVRDWIKKQGVTFNDQHEGVLFEEEVEKILEHKLQYPQPWNQERVKADIPHHYEGLQRLFNLGIPCWAEQGNICGVAGVVCDIVHAGHLLYFRACKQHCQHLTIGVDDNQLVKYGKGTQRPFNDLPVRVGTLSGIYEIDALHPIFYDQVSLEAFPTAYYPLRDKDPLNTIGSLSYDELKASKSKAEHDNPWWYQRVAPNIRLFWTAGAPKPVREAKKINAWLYGIPYIEFPKYTSLSTTRIAEHFGVQPTENHVNHFGVPPHWQRPYLKLTKEIFSS
jgi:hypothetical protein